MGYLDAYKKRLKKNNIREALRDDTVQNTIREFKNNPSYRGVILINSDLEEYPLDIRITNIKRTVYEKKFYLMPGQEANVGDYIKIEENDKIHYWLIEEYEWDAISPCARVTYCNQMIHFADGSHLPCIAQGESYGVKMSATNDILLETDTKVKVTVGLNKLSKKITPDFRMIFGHSGQGIYKTGDTTHYKENLVILTCKKDKEMVGLDDLENNIAWQPFYDYDSINDNYEITGEDVIRINKSYTYVLEPEIWCGFEIENIDNKYVKIEKTGINYITISCSKADEMITLKAIVGDKIIETKNILTIN